MVPRLEFNYSYIVFKKSPKNEGKRQKIITNFYFLNNLIFYLVQKSWPRFVLRSPYISSGVAHSWICDSDGQVSALVGSKNRNK